MYGKVRLLGILFFAVVILVIVYLSISLETEQSYQVSLIEIDGNSLLAKDDYYQFANLFDKSNYQNLTLQIIKDRLDKHPYINYADVKFDGNEKVTATLFEKNIESLLLVKDLEYLVSEDLEILPILPNLQNVNYPVIRDPKLEGEVEVLRKIEKKSDVLTAYKILATLELISPELFDMFSNNGTNLGCTQI